MIITKIYPYYGVAHIQHGEFEEKFAAIVVLFTLSLPQIHGQRVSNMLL